MADLRRAWVARWSEVSPVLVVMLMSTRHLVMSHLMASTRPARAAEWSGVSPLSFRSSSSQPFSSSRLPALQYFLYIFELSPS